MKAHFATDARTIYVAMDQEAALSGVKWQDRFKITEEFGGTGATVEAAPQPLMFLIGRLAALGEDGLIAVEDEPLGSLGQQGLKRLQKENEFLKAELVRFNNLF